MSYKMKKLLESQYHLSILKDLKTEQSIIWENLRHEKAMKNLNEREEKNIPTVEY